MNSIKDGFLLGNIPDCTDIDLHYDYKNGQLFCEDDSKGEKLQSIQNVHNDAIEYFTRINKYYASIHFWKGADNFIRIKFSLGSSNSYQSYIFYSSTSTEETMDERTVNIEDNWYVLRYTVG